MLCVPVFIIYIRQLSSFRVPRLWLLLLAIYNTLFWVYVNSFHEKTDKTRKYSKFAIFVCVVSRPMPDYHTLISHFRAFIMSTISNVFGLQLWNLAVLLILTCYFSWWGSFLWIEIQFMLISSRHIYIRSISIIHSTGSLKVCTWIIRKDGRNNLPDMSIRGNTLLVATFGLPCTICSFVRFLDFTFHSKFTNSESHFYLRKSISMCQKHTLYVEEMLRGTDARYHLSPWSPFSSQTTFERKTFNTTFILKAPIPRPYMW